MNIICTGNKEKKDFYYYLNNIIKHINICGSHNIYVDEYVSNGIDNIDARYESLYSNKIQFDFAISIGGDGALLSAVRRMKDRQLPVLGIHIGNLGFLNTATKKNYIETINNILNSKTIKTDNKSLVEVKFTNKDNKNIHFFALNEIFINQSGVSRVLSLRVSIDDVLLNTYRCDGLIVSTPTGSTAYSLSAGGPIIDLDVNGYVVTPVSPVSLSSRSIVINNSSNIKITCNADISQISIFADGQESDIILDGSTVNIFKSKSCAKIIRTSTDISYFSRLRSQLGWNK